MFDIHIVKHLNSKNVSINSKITKERLEQIWKAMSKRDKDEAVKIGDFSNARSFNKTRGSGQISVRMTMAIAIAMKINPFFITAENDDESDYSEDNLVDFIKKNNMSEFLEEQIEGVDKLSISDYVSKLVANLTTEKVSEINKLSNTELLTLLSAILIRDKISVEEELRIFMLKLILSSKI